MTIEFEYLISARIWNAATSEEMIYNEIESEWQGLIYIYIYNMRFETIVLVISVQSAILCWLLPAGSSYEYMQVYGT